jgi:antitoxin component HigA of HigAB toxin-antitoxin module
MDFKNITKIETEEQYDAVCERIDELIDEATEKGMLGSDYDNEYTREIERLLKIGSIYEGEDVIFKALRML